MSLAGTDEAGSLLAQNREADRDRADTEHDREVNVRSLADTEFLAREIAAIRVALESKTDRDDLRVPADPQSSPSGYILTRGADIYSMNAQDHIGDR